jgi:hypothetical protein
MLGAALLAGATGAGTPSGAAPPPVSAPHQHHHTTGVPRPDAAGPGFLLAAGEAATPRGAAECDPQAVVREYAVVALAVDITLNRYLDHDPRGRMYALEEDLARIRAEEARNAAARSGSGEPAVSVGVQGDAIQPLALRVVPGECLRIRFRNDLPGGEPAGIDLHGGTLTIAGTDPPRPALGSEPGALVEPGRTVTYEWMVAAGEPEGPHYFHSHGPLEREHALRGLFGAVIVEPAGSTWTDPRSGAPLKAGWDAVVTPGSGPAFREFALFYHEVGDETYQVVDRAGAFVPLVDPLTQAYRPDGRALNYRSEPFLNRLALQQRVAGVFDESLAYSSYTFGDPATPVLRSYLGDPVKQRVVHGGSEVFHVHHVHGGGVRWKRQPGEEPNRFDAGLDKHPPLRPEATERTDSQSIGPSETYDLVNECGSGGCQQTVGDLMVHCHVFHHYFGGMWGLWRVYNTTQDGPASTDDLPPLLELPDRGERTEPAVTSDRLLGTSVEWAGRRLDVGLAELTDVVTRQLPPPAVPRDYDASVFDWARDGDVFLGQPETTQVWPGYRPRRPGTRPPLLFDRDTGKLAYPFLRPHLGQRPPFAPEHGPAPYLDPVRAGPDPPDPGANGPASICPAGARGREIDLTAISVPVSLNPKLVDGQGQLFVLREQLETVRSDPAARVPLVLRANAGEHCLDVLLRSELTDTDATPFSKVSAHVHFMQFDVQGSDGVTTGFNYEQTVRPFRAAGAAVTVSTSPGATAVRLSDAARFQPGTLVGVGLDRDDELEFRHVTAVASDLVTLDAPLAHAHAAGEVVSTEFVRHRWYPDTQFGTAFLHDHTNVLASGRHGLFGAVVVEPPHSTYHDPHTGAELVSGPIADIHTAHPVSADITGSFREAVLLIQDDNPLTAVGRSSGSSINLRAEPPEARGRDPAARFDTADSPATPVVEAYVGDPLVLRTLVGAANDVHTMHVDGHWFRAEPWSGTSAPTNTVSLGISERFDLSVARAGGPQGRPGDYLFYNGRSFKLREGSWGVLRVRDGPSTPGLQPLPGRDPPAARPGPICPDGAPRKGFDVAAVETPLPMLGGRTGKVFALSGERAATRSVQKRPEPLVLHVNVGDCVEVRLTNNTGQPVSLHADLLAFDPVTSGGIANGHGPPQTVAPGAEHNYTWYASPEVGATTALLRDWGDVLANPSDGLYGAVVVGPVGSRYTDPVTGEDAAAGSSSQVDVHPPAARPYREFTLFFQDEDAGLGTHRMPYAKAVDGAVGVNYGTSEEVGVASTPLLEASVGDLIRINLLAPSSEQVQVFGVEGHRWAREPGRSGTDLLSSVAFGGMDARTLWLDAGGPGALTGDYRYGNARAAYREAGQWGVLRAHPACLRPPAVQPLDESCGASATTLGGVVLTVMAVAGTALVWWRRRRAQSR